MAAQRLKESVRRAARIGLLVGCGALAGGLALESWRLARAVHENRQLAQQLADHAPEDTQAALPQDNPRLWIGAARQPARLGHIAEAAALLRRAADASQGDLASMAWYDLGNLYLREALRLLRGGADASALPLIELSKESYRSALLERPDLWDAKFNLELALRLAPDPDLGDTGAPPVLTGERAVTTMRAFTLGLP